MSTIFCSPAFQRREEDIHHSLLVIQCDSGHLNGDLIACARYRIYDKRAEASLRHEREGCTHVLFIIHLPRQTVGSSFVGFQGEPWISTHIDDLRPTKGGAITLQEVMGVSISQLFCGKMAADKSGRIGENKISSVAGNLEELFCGNMAGTKRLLDCIQPAATRVQDSAKNKERATKRVGILVNLIPRDPSFPLGDLFLHAYMDYIPRCEVINRKWYKNLQQFPSFTLDLTD